MKDVKEILERVVPEPARQADWDAVLRDARPSGARRAAPRLAILAAAVAVAALFAAAPWRGAERAGVLDRALAAVGDGPVLHVVLRYDPGVTRVDLKTAKREPLYGDREFWYDANRGLLHEIRRFGGVVEYEWVSRTKRPLDDLDELAVLSREYRTALEAGTARVTGEDVIEGIPVYWITLLPTRNGFSWQVAISRETYKPVAIRGASDGKPGAVSERVLRLETMGADMADLDEADVTSSPTRDPSAKANNFGGGDIRIPIGQAAKTLGRTPFWLGPEHAGLPLADQASRNYVRGPGGEVQTTGISLHYEKPVTPNVQPGHRSISIIESRDPDTLPWPVGLLRGGWILVKRNGAFEKFSPPIAMYRGSLVHDGVYISIDAVGYGPKSILDEELILDAARALRPMPASSDG
jgi:hypothetical protein